MSWWHIASVALLGVMLRLRRGYLRLSSREPSCHQTQWASLGWSLALDGIPSGCARQAAKPMGRVPTGRLKASLRLG